MANVKKYGNDQLDEDKTALREAKSGDAPHPLLLQARLLFDGGYLVRSYKLLNAANETYFQDTNDKLEYNYRKGRVAHSLKNYQDALKYYAQTIQKGRQNSSYFACNAALNIGMIYEGQKKKDAARQYYNCLLYTSPSPRDRTRSRMPSSA